MPLAHWIFIGYLALLSGKTIREPAWYAPTGLHPPGGCHFVRQRSWKRALFMHNTSTLLCWQDSQLVQETH